MALQPGTKLGPYEIQLLIGSGGMGEVYRATDTRLHRPVAIKVLPEELTSSAVAMERFQREARTASVLNHPNICTIYDVGTSHPLFIAMELLEGESLHQRLARGRMDVQTLIAIGIGTAEGLDAAHNRGFIHRDIKPANIFLTAHGPKLLDFGLAKARLTTPVGALSSDETVSAAALQTDAGVTVGTIAYMSPEQLRGKDVDARSDVFSLGLVLYEMATGRRAFVGKTSAEISAAILYEQPLPPRELVRVIPPRLNDIILKTLEKDREDRCQTAAELRADLRRLKRELESHPSHATLERISASQPAASTAEPSPVTDTRIALELIKRHRVGLIVANVLVVLAVLAGSLFYLRSISGESADASSLISLENVQVAQLTTTGDAGRPAITRDGNYLAYVRQQKGEYSLHVRQTAMATTVEIVKAEPNVALFGATVSPDSGFVDFVRRVQAQTFELWRVPFLGGVSRRLLDRVNSPIGWSPDGKRFAFIRADASRGTTALVLVDADGSNERVLAERQRPAQFVSLMIAARPSIAPTWSPDGRMLAITGAGAGANSAEGDVSFVDVESGSPRTIALPSSAIRGLVWFNDKTLLLNAATPGSSMQLHQLSYPDGQLHPLTRDVNDYDGISLAADGRTLIGSRRERRTDIAIVDTSGRTVVGGPAIDAMGRETAVATFTWSGDRILYGKFAWVPRSTPQQLLQDAEHTTSSPDGLTLVYRSGNGLWKADRDGGRASLLVAGDAWNPAVTSDNQVIFLSSRTGQQSPWIVPLGGGEPKQLVNRFAGFPGVAISPDGQSMMFGSRDEQQNRSVAVVCPLADCSQPKIIPDLGSSRLRWTPDGRAITFVPRDDRTNLWTIPITGGSASELTHFEDRAIVEFDWSPDGTRLVVARELETTDIVVLKGLRRE